MKKILTLKFWLWRNQCLTSHKPVTVLNCVLMSHMWRAYSTTYIHVTFLLGLLLFYVGMAVNIHSDYTLRNLRKPGEVIYKIPTGRKILEVHSNNLYAVLSDPWSTSFSAGGLFEYVSGANYFGEIVEWFGYALATWSLPALSFAVFSLCFIGPRAYYHHRCLTFTKSSAIVT